MPFIAAETEPTQAHHLTVMIKFAYCTHRFTTIAARNEICFPRSDEGFVGAVQSGECM